MNAPESAFLIDFFSELKTRGLPYGVLRNSDTLPESLGGSDLDLLALDDKTARLIYMVACEVAKKNGGSCVCSYRVEVVVASFMGRLEDGTWWGVHIDIIPGVKYYGIPYMSAEPILAERELVKGSFYKCGPLADITSFFKEIIRNRKTRKDYYPKARAAFALNPEGVRSAFLPYCGKRGWVVAERLLSQDGDDAFIARESRRFTRALWLEYLLRFRWATLACVKANNIYRRLRRVVCKPGYAIAFLGTDGSGKSTLIDNVRPTIEQMLHGKVHYEHLRPNLLPALAQLAGKPKKTGPTTNPHGGKQAGWVASLARFFYYYIDYMLGFWAKIYPILVKRQAIVFFDRYYYEYMIDQKRCAVRLLPGFARFFSWFIPKPDLILCLGGDPEKIFARKPETSLAEVTRQVNELKAFCSQNRRAVWIDTTTGINESRDAALNAIMERMANR